MGLIPLDKFSINRFWEKTPTPLKYILIFSTFIVITYFFVSKRIYTNQTLQIEKIDESITITYELIDSFEEFRIEQDQYNKEILIYVKNLHSLLSELNETTNRKFNMLLKSGNQNADVIVEKIMLLNESFERLTKAYTPEIERPNLNDNKVNNLKPNREYNIGVKPDTTK